MIMCDPAYIIQLYTNVLNKDVLKYRLRKEDIIVGIQNMKEAYRPNPTSLKSCTVDVADYNQVSHRCAYLHKYAPFHTFLVAEFLKRALTEEWQVFKFILLAHSGCLKICSLGGGPGTDVVGVLAALHDKFGFFQCSAAVVDIMSRWEESFRDIVCELQSGWYGTLGQSFRPQYFDCSYLTANLLSKMDTEVSNTIASANLVTMIKFVSAAACKDTSAMIKEIFKAMKPGALVLYIDNAGGGFHRLVERAAHECKFLSVFGPNKHEHYRNEAFNIKKFGYTSCFETKVTVHILMKTSFTQDTAAISDRRLPQLPYLNQNQPKMLLSPHQTTLHQLSAQVRDKKSAAHKQMPVKNQSLTPKRIMPVQNQLLPARNENWSANNSSRSRQNLSKYSIAPKPVTNENERNVYLQVPEKLPTTLNVNLINIVVNTPVASSARISEVTIPATKMITASETDGDTGVLNSMLPSEKNGHGTNKASRLISGTTARSTSRTASRRESRDDCISRNAVDNDPTVYGANVWRPSQQVSQTGSESRHAERIKKSPTIVSSQPLLTRHKQNAPSHDEEVEQEPCCACCVIL